jgi:tetratricopeptide (TPR) repeat protein
MTRPGNPTDGAPDDDYEDDPYARPPEPRRSPLATMLWGLGAPLSIVKLLSGLPAVAAVAAAISVAATPRPDLEADYRAQAREALQIGDFPRLKTLTARLLQLSPRNPETQYWAGVALDGLGDAALAETTLEAVAPANAAGYGPAHFYLAERHLRSEPLTPEALARAESHLRRVSSEGELAKPTTRRLAQVLLKTGRIVEARKLLTLDLLTDYPDLRVVYGEALLKSQVVDEGREQLRQAATTLRVRLASAPDDWHARWNLVEACALAGDFPTGEKILRDGAGLGKPDQSVRMLANFYVRWIAENDAGRVPIGPEKSAVDRTADMLAKQESKSLAAQGLLVYLYRFGGRLEEAQQVLEALAPGNLGAAFDLIRLHQQRGKPAEAKAAARRVAEPLRQLVSKEPTSFAHRERLASALLALDDFAGAKEVLEEGARKTKDPRYNALVAATLVNWWDASHAGRVPKPEDSIGLLRDAVKLDPWNAAVFQRLSAAPPAEADAAKAMLSELLARGESPPAAIHWILGNSAWARGDLVMAKSHLEQSYKLSPKNPLVLNNLAWVLAHAMPPDLPRALQLANEAVALSPAALELRDTRGRIRAKLGDWREALADLQLCLAYKKGDPEFHRIVADAFASQRMNDLADHHRKLAADAEAQRRGKP